MHLTSIVRFLWVASCCLMAASAQNLPASLTIQELLDTARVIEHEDQDHHPLNEIPVDIAEDIQPIRQRFRPGLRPIVVESAPNPNNQPNFKFPPSLRSRFRPRLFNPKTTTSTVTTTSSTTSIFRRPSGLSDFLRINRFKTTTTILPEIPETTTIQSVIDQTVVPTIVNFFGVSSTPPTFVPSVKKVARRPRPKTQRPFQNNNVDIVKQQEEEQPRSAPQQPRRLRPRINSRRRKPTTAKSVVTGDQRIVLIPSTVTPSPVTKPSFSFDDVIRQQVLSFNKEPRRLNGGGQPRPVPQFLFKDVQTTTPEPRRQQEDRLFSFDESIRQFSSNINSFQQQQPKTTTTTTEAPRIGIVESSRRSFPRQFKVDRDTEFRPDQQAERHIQVLEHYQVQEEDGSLTWGYQSEDGSFKEETRGADCVTRGRYGYIDPEGELREFSYKSGLPCNPETKQEIRTTKTGYYDYNINRFIMPDGRKVKIQINTANKARG